MVAYRMSVLNKQIKTALNAGKIIRGIGTTDEQIVAWAEYLLPFATDDDIIEAFHLCMSGGTEVYGKVDVADINKAIKIVRSKRVNDWIQRNKIAIEFDGPPARGFIYKRVFMNCIAGGMCDTKADQHGRQALERAETYLQQHPEKHWGDALDMMTQALEKGNFVISDSKKELPSPRTKDKYMLPQGAPATIREAVSNLPQLPSGQTRAQETPVERARAVQAAIEAARRKMSLHAVEELRKQERLRQQRDGRFQRLTGIDPTTIGPQR
jgi:hypothetical protein